MTRDVQTIAIVSADMKLLCGNLGALETAIFIAKIGGSDFDYTTWRENLWDGLTPRDLLTARQKVRALRNNRFRYGGAGAGGKMEIILNVFGGQRKAVLAALRKKETIPVIDGGKVVAVLQPPPVADIPRTKAFGMWADREEIADPTAWVHEQRGIRRRRRSARNAGKAGV